MDTYEMGPLLQSSTLSGGLFWALALYLPLSGPPVSYTHLTLPTIYSV